MTIELTGVILLFQKSTTRLHEYGSLAELATVSLEHPSPVSVLDSSVYRDDSPSPVKQTTISLKGKVLLRLTLKCVCA